MSVSDITNKLIKNGIDAVRTIDEENTVLKARIAKLEDALRWYQDNLRHNLGHRAREALKDGK